MTSPVTGTFRPGTSWLHRARAGAKLGGLSLFGVAVLVVPGWPAAVVALGVGIGLALTAGVGGRGLWRVTRGFALVAALLFAFQVWQHGWERGVDVVAGLLALIFAASAVTSSTSTDDMIDVIMWVLMPLRGIGVSPEKVALAMSLAIRSIPLAIEVARETRAAARARGLERNLRAYTTPFVLRLVAHARHTGEALQARGLGDE